MINWQRLNWAQSKNHGGKSGEKEADMGRFIDIPTNPLLSPDSVKSEADETRIEKYGDLATCDVALNDEKRLIQVNIQDPTLDEDRLLVQTTWENVAADVLSSIGARLMAMGKKRPGFLDNK